ncbi:MAG: PqqD family protein [Candidatus Riflebacteria bacterium]|nr:PqqD family protein [Candidatus Riflebacteria bacterium]
MEINSEMKFSRSENIVAGLVDGDFMLSDLQSGKYHQMNGTGKMIWEILEQPMTVSEICDSLVKEFEVEPDNCLKELKIFLKELFKKNILQIICYKSTN